MRSLAIVTSKNSKPLESCLMLIQYRGPLLSVREYTMMEFMNRITDKPGWEKKVFDEIITKKWKSEALSAPSIDISERMVNWVGHFAPLS